MDVLDLFFVILGAWLTWKHFELQAEWSSAFSDSQDAQDKLMFENRRRIEALERHKPRLADVDVKTPRPEQPCPKGPNE